MAPVTETITAPSFAPPFMGAKTNNFDDAPKAMKIYGEEEKKEEVKEEEKDEEEKTDVMKEALNLIQRDSVAWETRSASQITNEVLLDNHGLFV